MNELPDLLTPLTSLGVVNALLVNFETTGRNPTRRAVLLKAAQVHLETGLRSCHRWNIGNIKETGGKNPFCCFACDENVDRDAKGDLPIILQSPLVTVVSTWLNTKTGRLRSNVKIKPPHPWSRFRAFDNLIAGAKGQMEYLNHHPVVLEALMTGDPVNYGQALKDAGYYTAPASPVWSQGKLIHPGYKAILAQRLAIVIRETASFDWGDVQP